MTAGPQAAYIHVPFCRHRCGYCNFTVSSSADRQAEPYLQAVQRELLNLGGVFPVRSLFFGGGTPTHLRLPQLNSLFEMVFRSFPPESGAEISVEANPEDIDVDLCRLLADWGVNRVSLGVQSFHPDKLRCLERSHTAATVEMAIRLLRTVTENLSVDLIFGAPDETLSLWRQDLEAACQQLPTHISTYGLTYERGTTFWSRRMRSELLPIGESVEREMFEWAIDYLTSHGWHHYEVSNFARPGHECQHNCVYWRGEEYFAIGPGAARYVAGRRETNHRSTTTYIRRVLADISPVQESETLSDRERLRERIVLALRMIDGISIRAFEDQHQVSLAAVLGGTFEEFQRQGWWELRDGSLRLTRDGLMISDSLWSHVLASDTPQA